MTITPACLSTFDQQMTQIIDRIRAKHRAHIRELSVDVGWEGLIVRGIANSYYGKQLAFHELSRYSGVPVVANEVEVRHDSPARAKFNYDQYSLSESASRN